MVGVVYLVKERQKLVGSKTSNVLVFFSFFMSDKRSKFPGQKPFFVTHRDKKHVYTSFSKAVFVGMVQRQVLQAAGPCPCSALRQEGCWGQSVLFLAKPLGCLVTSGEPFLVSIVTMCMSLHLKFGYSKNPVLSKPFKDGSS